MPSSKENWAESWWDKAHANLSSARHSLAGGFFDTACFQSHQTAEVGLKAYLLGQGMQIDEMRIHALPQLLALCQDIDASFADLIDECNDLNVFYIDTRYPDPDKYSQSFDSYDAREAVKAASRVFSFIDKRIKTFLKPSKSKRKK